MSDLISYIEDQYLEYLELCKKKGIIPRDINNPYWTEEYFKLEKLKQENL